MLHGINYPRIWHGNALTGHVEYGGLFEDAPEQFDCILTNPPFGGKEGSEARSKFAYKTSSTQVLFLQHVIDALAPGGRAGMVVDEGLLFRNNERAFVQTKAKLLDECNVHTVVSLAPGVFTTAGSSVKTNLIFFDKGESTESIWYYELNPPPSANEDVRSPLGSRFTKKRRLTLNLFKQFFELLDSKPETEDSWNVTRNQIEANNFDLKAVNPNRPESTDARIPADFLDEIDQHQRVLTKILAELRETLQTDL